MRIVGNDPTLSRQITATASGAISAAGKPLLVNTDGTVAEVAISTASKGSVADAGFNSNVGGPYLTGLPGVSKFVAFARDQDNSYYGTAIVGVVSGSSISYGSAASTSHAQYENFDVLGLTSTTFVIVYRDSGDSNKGKARLGTVDASDNSITYGSVAEFEAGQTSMNDFGNAARLTDTTFVIAFEDASDSSKAKAIVGTVSGTSLSFGSPATFATANSSKYASIGALSSTKIVIAYSDTPASPPEDGEVIVGTISGTSISFGSATQYDADRVIRHSLAALSDTKFVIAYNDDRTGNNYATAIVGTVSGTNITLGSPVVFRASDESNVWPSVTKFTENDFVVAYLNDDSKPAAIKGSTSGTTITFGSSTELDSTAVTFIYGTTVNDEKIVAGFAPSNNLSAIVYNPSSVNLTSSENFIGTSAHSVADGAKVLVNTQGAIDENQSVAATLSAGSDAVYESAVASETNIAFVPSANKFVIIYKDEGNSSYGTAVVATVSGTSVTYGSPTVFRSEPVQNMDITVDTNVDRVAISFEKTSGGTSGQMVIGTVSGTSLSFGSDATFVSDAVSTAVTFDSSNNKVVVAYEDDSGSDYTRSRVATIDSSDNSVTFGTEVAVEEANTAYQRIVFDSNSNKVVVIYRYNDGGTYSGRAKVGTVSGTDISFGSATTFHSGNFSQPDIEFDSANNKVVIVYANEASSAVGTAIVGTVSGTSISFGSAVVFNNGDTSTMGLTFNTTQNHFVIAYRDQGDSNKLNAIIGTVSGTSISFGTEVSLTSGAALWIKCAYDSNADKVLVSYQDGANSDYGTAIVATASTDLTIGQTYFVQTDGTLSTSADSPSVIAGTAISGTDLIVKG